jgi:ABC-2 type transport system permease protein
MMFRRILLHEWRTLAADATVWVVGGVFAVAIGYGLWNGVRWTAFQEQALAAARAEEDERYTRLNAQLVELAQPGAKISPFADPRNPSAFGGRLGPRYAALPPAPLAPLSIGQSDLLPYYVKVSTDARENIVSATEIENPSRLQAGRFDLTFVIIYLYPLLILALCYNMLSAEKEQGTLAMVLSQPVALGTLASGKVVLRAGVVIGLVLALSAAAMAAAGVDLGAPGAAARFALWAGAVTAYGLFWFGLALLVASFGRGSTTNATVLATAWLVLVVMTPSLFNLVATGIYPVPSRVELVQATREAAEEANKAGSQVLARYYDDHPELATGDPDQAMTDFNIVRVAVNDDVERRVRPLVQRYESQVAAQQAMIDRLQFLSPAILMQNALNDVAGTGTARHRHFMAQVDAFHATWRGHFVPLIFAKRTVDSVAAVPSFTFDEEPMAALAGRVAAGLAGLALPAVILVGVGLRRLGGYPIVG